MTGQPRARARSVEEMRELGRRAAAVLRAGGYQIDALSAIGVAERTYYKWLEGEDEAAVAFQSEVFPAYRDAAKAAEDKAEHDIASTEMGSSAWANWHKWKLEKRYPKVFGAAQRVELTGKDGGPIQHQDVRTMSTEELVEIASKAEEPGDE